MSAYVFRPDKMIPPSALGRTVAVPGFGAAMVVPATPAQRAEKKKRHTRKSRRRRAAELAREVGGLG